MPNDITVDDFLAHYGAKGMKWGVRKTVQTSSKPSAPLKPATTKTDSKLSTKQRSGQSPPKQKLSENKYVILAKGSKAGNITNLAITAAGITAVATSAPVSVPLLIGGTVSARVAIKSYEAYRVFYTKHPSRMLPPPKPDDMARLKVGQDLRKELTKKHGSVKVSDM